MWGSRVIMPSKYHAQLLGELHEGHLGILKMKALTRSYMWWPGMDKAIEEVGKGCTEYQLSQNNPQTARPHVWEWPVRPWQRFHVFNVLSPKVIPMTSTSAARIMNRGTKEAVLHTWLTRTADQFRTFVRSKGMKHMKSAPYHPNTNGMAERFVQRFKQALRALTKNHLQEADQLLASLQDNTTCT